MTEPSGTDVDRSGDASSLNDCFLHDKDRLSHQEALGLIEAQCRSMVGTKMAALAEAAGFYAAKEIRAGFDVPGHNNAAVDGYGFAHGDLVGGDPKGEGAATFRLSARIAAGASDVQPLAPGTAVRIFTGAPVPPGADTVVMQEDVTLSDPGSVIVPAGLKKGANVRLAGEDVKSGGLLISPGQRLRPQDLAWAASVGCGEIEIHKPLRIGVLSTGDEVRRPGAPLASGQVYDANSFLLRGLLQSLPVEISDLGILPDDAGFVRDALKDASTIFDVIISSGGASRGEEDYLVNTVRELGTLHGWQIAIKPGRPLGFGTIGKAAVMALPGNPVAALVCFLLYARPMLTRLGGGVVYEPRRFPLPANFEIKSKKPDRREFLRGFTSSQDGQLLAEKFPRNGSGLISSLCRATGLIEVPEEVTRIDRGDMVAFIPFSEFGIAPDSGASGQ